MSDIAISCTGLSKQYKLGERESYKALRDVISDAAAAPFRRLRAAMSNGNGVDRESAIVNRESAIVDRESAIDDGYFWALNDVTFEVKRGEAVGIIGRNGAGKSTLLKILSRITKPTRGTAEIHGRVGSLLEVGTGFHPELTGRENIYLNGAILGMRKAEIDRNFDEIVAFAEVEKFVDTPVKRYSSGMYVRLAFAVAAHLEPEILVIDEVLAVGDAAFQKKCLGKMGEVAQHGRTVLFVSHNMNAIIRLCNRAVLLVDGRVAADGEVGATVDAYLMEKEPQDDAVDLSNQKRVVGVHGAIVLKHVRMSNPGPYGPWKLSFGDRVSFEVEFEVLNETDEVDLAVALSSNRGFELASCLSSHSLPKSRLPKGSYKYIVEYDNLRLVPGSYRFGLGIRSTFGFEDCINDAFELQVLPSEVSSSLNVDLFHGAIVPDVRFKLESYESEQSVPESALVEH